MQKDVTAEKPFLREQYVHLNVSVNLITRILLANNKSVHTKLSLTKKVAIEHSKTCSFGRCRVLFRINLSQTLRSRINGEESLKKDGLENSVKYSVAGFK